MPKMAVASFEHMASHLPAVADDANDGGAAKHAVPVARDIAAELRDMYRSVLEELADEGKIRHYHARDLWFGTEKMDAYLGCSSSGTGGSWDDGHAYRYWVYAIKLNQALAPAVEFELGPKDQTNKVLLRQELLRARFAPTRKPITSADRYRRIMKIETGVDESSTVSATDVDLAEGRSKIKAAIEELLKRETEYFKTIEEGTSFSSKGSLA